MPEKPQKPEKPTQGKLSPFVSAIALFGSPGACQQLLLEKKATVFRLRRSPSSSLSLLVRTALKSRT